jgi:putative hydrolase of the HAD superfamily
VEGGAGLTGAGAAMTTLTECSAILFDFGGTLDSDGGHWLDRFYTLYDEAGLRLPPEEVKRAFYRADAACEQDPEVGRMGLRPLMQLHVRLQLEALGVRDPDRERQLVEGFCRPTETVLRRNARLLPRLGRTRRLGVVSNFYGNVEVLCREAGLAESFAVVVDSARVGVRKPDPAIFHMALDRLGAPAARALFVGDSLERDLRPAQGLGMRTVWLKGPAARPPQDAVTPDAVIATLPELEALLA